jgi:hypothetical protein
VFEFAGSAGWRLRVIRRWQYAQKRQIRMSGHVRSQTQTTEFGAAPCGHRASQVSGHKTVLHACLAWVGHVA